jgi:hypothetical protein
VLRRAAWYPYAPKDPAPDTLSEWRTWTETPDFPAVLEISQSSDFFSLAVSARQGGKLLASIKVLPLESDSKSTNGSARHPSAARTSSGRPAWWEPRPDGRRPVFSLVAGGDSCLMYAQGHLVHCRLAELASAIPKPFFIEPRQSTFVLALNQPNEVKYVAERARGFRLESRDLSSTAEPLQLDSATGVFQIALAPDVVQRQIHNTVLLLANLPKGREADNAARLADYLRTTADPFTRIVGRAPQGVPIPIHVSVIAEGPQLETAAVLHDFLIEVPPERVAAALDQQFPRASAGKVPTEQKRALPHPLSR